MWQEGRKLTLIGTGILFSDRYLVMPLTKKEISIGTRIGKVGFHI